MNTTAIIENETIKVTLTGRYTVLDSPPDHTEAMKLRASRHEPNAYDAPAVDYLFEAETPHGTLWVNEERLSVRLEMTQREKKKYRRYRRKRLHRSVYLCQKGFKYINPSNVDI